MRQQAQRRLGDHAEQPFAADEKAREIEALLVLVRAPAALQHAAVSEHDFEAEHVVARHAIFQAARAAGIRRDVAAEAAFLQRRGIGRIEEPELPHCGLQLAGDHARFHDGDSVGKMDLLDPIHARHAQRDAAAQRHAPADVADARAARRDGDTVPVCKAQRLLHVAAVAREHHGIGRSRGKPLVRGMDGERGVVGADGVTAEELREFSREVHREIVSWPVKNFSSVPPTCRNVFSVFRPTFSAPERTLVDRFADFFGGVLRGVSQAVNETAAARRTMRSAVMPVA